MEGFVDALPLGLEAAGDKEAWRLDLWLIAGDVLKRDPKKSGLIGEDVTGIGMVCETSEDCPVVYGSNPLPDVESIELIVEDDVCGERCFDSRALTNCVDNDMPGRKTERSCFECIKQLPGNDSMVSTVPAESRLPRK